MFGVVIFFVVFAAICGYKLWRWWSGEQERKVHRARGERVFGELVLADTWISYRGQTQPLTNVTATVESVGQLQRRITATRLATIGVFALAMQKKQDDRELYMTIVGPQFEWLIEYAPDSGAGARKIAAIINTAARNQH